MIQEWTVGRLARRFGLSRSTLLYYDSIGLLRPSGRSGRDYRLYDQAAVERLERIMAYRSAGVPLSDIREILDAPLSAPAEVLERRFAELEREMAALRRQQHLVASLLSQAGVLVRPGITKDAWVAILEELGFSELDMERWHAGFERSAPEEHRQFLEYLGIAGDEVAAIRQWARTRGSQGQGEGEGAAGAG